MISLSVSICSFVERFLQYPAFDAGTVEAAMSSYSPLSMRMMSFCAWGVICMSRLLGICLGSSDGPLEFRMVTHCLNDVGNSFVSIILHSAFQYSLCVSSDDIRNR